MSASFNIIRVFFLLSLASFSSTALAVTVSSEMGGASLDGVWAFPGGESGEPPGCYKPDPNDDKLYDSAEYLVFQGDSVESRLVVFPSSDGSCSGVGVVQSIGPFDLNVIEDFESPGWGEDGSESAPECQDQSKCQDNGGLLDPTPEVTRVEYVLSEEESEIDIFYIDDTGLTWYLYRHAGQDDAPSEFMSGGEPLIKTNLPVGIIPVPAGVWLFGSAIIGFVGYSRRRKLG